MVGNVGTMKVTAELLVNLMGLPSDTKIVGAKMDAWDARHGVVNFLVEHKDIPPTIEGAEFPIVEPAVEKIQPGLRFLHW